MGAEVRIDTTPNENALKYTVIGKQVIESGHKTYNSVNDAGDCPVAQTLFGLEGVTSVFLMADFITVTKAPGASWDNIQEQAMAAIQSAYE